MKDNQIMICGTISQCMFELHGMVFEATGIRRAYPSNLDNVSVL